jgi:poly(3-hydroxybutyrate) depolymerase
MVEQAAHTWPVRTDRFLLHGFSAGGQFAHRFAYLHAHRLTGVSIGAPGKITLPARTAAWPSGVRDLHAIFGADVQWDTLKRVPAHFVVGEKDTTPQRAADDGDGARMLRTRIENVHALRDAWHEEGLACRLDVVAGVGHSGLKCLGPVFEFFTPLVASMHTRNII